LPPTLSSRGIMSRSEQSLQVTAKVGTTEASSSAITAALRKVSACFYSGYGNFIHTK
jgi:hypothetical protein